MSIPCTCSSADPKEAHVIPFLETLDGFPPTFIATGTLDLFYAENLRFAAALTEAGVEAEQRQGLNLTERAWKACPAPGARPELSDVLPFARFGLAERLWPPPYRDVWKLQRHS